MYFGDHMYDDIELGIWSVWFYNEKAIWIIYNASTCVAERLGRRTPELN